MTKISVIIPTHKRKAEVLKRSLDSVIDQKLDNDYSLEIIISNNSYEKLGQSFYDNENIKIIESTKIFNVCFARNNGFKKSTGEYVAFLDDDDYWDENFLSKALKAMKNTNTDMAICGFNNVDKDNKITKGKIIKKDMSIKDVIDTNPGLTGSNFVITRKKFIEINGFDENLPTSNDKDFLIQFIENKGKYSIVKKYLVYRDNSEHSRLTSISLTKITGTLNFYNKYKNIMSKDQKNEYEIKLAYYNIYLKKSILKSFILLLKNPNKARLILGLIKHILIGKKPKI